jgi:hypothetical protein
MIITGTMLIYNVSLELQSSACITIHNLCSNIKPVLSDDFCTFLSSSELSNQPMDIEAKTNASFEINTTQCNSMGALLFKLQRYSDNQHNIDTSTTEVPSTCS